MTEPKLDLLHTAEAQCKRLHHTKKTRLLQERRFHEAYLDNSPIHQPEQAWEYLDGNPHENTVIAQENPSVDRLSIDITPDHAYVGVEDPAELTGDTEQRRRKRYARIHGHQRKTKDLTEKLSAYRANTQPKARKSRLTRQRLADRQTTYNSTPAETSTPSNPSKDSPDQYKPRYTCAAMYFCHMPWI
mgnify:FL=1